MAELQSLIEAWDGECVLVRYDRPTGAWVFIAIHDRTLGMAMGGCRMKTYPSPADGLRDAQRLAAGMTLKWAGIEFPLGGGKAVLAVPGPLEPQAREGLLLRFGELVESLGGLYGTGVDLGTSPADMTIVGRKTSRVAGREPAAGGAGDPGPWTALGVFEGMRVAAARAFPDAGEGAGGGDEEGVAAVSAADALRGRRVLVQGAGGVGRPLARLLADAGAEVVVSDVDAGRARAVADEVGGVTVAPDAAYGADVDVFAPCAVGAVLNPDTIGRLRCRVVAGSANNQLESDADAERLAERGILYVPDFVVNAGGAVAHGLLEFLGGTEADVDARVRRIGGTVAAVLDEAAERGETPLAAAVRRSRRHIEAAGTPPPAS